MNTANSDAYPICSNLLRKKIFYAAECLGVHEVRLYGITEIIFKLIFWKELIYGFNKKECLIASIATVLLGSTGAFAANDRGLPPTLTGQKNKRALMDMLVHI